MLRKYLSLREQLLHKSRTDTVILALHSRRLAFLQAHDASAAINSLVN